MHAIWFSALVPAFVAAVWIWPTLRLPTLWLTCFLLTLAGTALWIVSDLIGFLDTPAGSKGSLLRTVYLLLRDTDKPVLQCMLGTALAALFAGRLPRRPNGPHGVSSTEHDFPKESDNAERQGTAT